VKKISAKSTSGSEAIIIGLIRYWVSTRRPQWSQAVAPVYEHQYPKFTAKSETKLGETYGRLNPETFKKFYDDFMKSMKSNPSCKFMLECAALEHDPLASKADNIKWAHSFIDRCLFYLIGQEIKRIKDD
jgi:hypothetical protein